MTEHTHDMTIEAKFGCTADALEQSALLAEGNEQIAALKAFILSKGGTFSCRPVRRGERKASTKATAPNGATQPVHQNAHRGA
jgi:hypothetical protein